VLLGNYHGVEKENLSLPFISIKFSIACGTFSTGYKDTKIIGILGVIQHTQYLELVPS